MTGYQYYFCIRTGKYRIGCRITGDNEIIFYRVKSREEITGSFHEYLNCRTLPSISGKTWPPCLGPAAAVPG
jgi:hypothetical protein